MKKITFLLLYISIIYFTGCSSAEHYLTQDIAEYGNYAGHIQKEESDRWSGLYIFPEKITEDMKDVVFYYECGNAYWDDDYILYLECKMNDENFYNELERLKDINVSHDGETHYVRYIENGWNYPVYLTIYDSDDHGNISVIEYAAVDRETKTIAYVFNQLASDAYKRLDSQYIMTKESKLDNSLEVENFNIYLFKEGDIGSYIY